MELLFEGRSNLGGMSGNLWFFQRQPAIHPQPVLLGDSAVDNGLTSLYGSVLRDQGKFRMWYYASPRGDGRRSDASYVAYAESDDGLTFTKPALGIVEPELAGNNLTNLGLHSATVFIDPDSPPEFRYRATGCGRQEYGGNFHGITQRGYYTAHSADGLRWALDAPEPRWHSIDVITSIYHPGRRAGIVALKHTPTWMRMARRSIHTAEFKDGVYSDEVSALYADEYDDLCAANRGFHSCDYYGMGMLPTGKATVGFLWKYWHELPYSKGWGNKEQALYGRSDIALVYQPEPGGRWLHVPGRPIFIDRTALPWEAGWINTASNVVEVGNEQRLYFSWRNTPHGYGLDLNWKPIAHRNYADEVSGVTFAHWPKWRLFGFECYPSATLEIRLGKLDQPCEIYLNYESMRPDGHVTAAISDGDTPVYAHADCLPLTGDQTEAKIAWKSGTRLPAMANAKLTLDLEKVRVYAYEVRPCHE